MTSQVGPHEVPLPADLLAAVEAALSADEALRVTPQEEVQGRFSGKGGEPMNAEEARKARDMGRRDVQVGWGGVGLEGVGKVMDGSREKG